MCARAGSDAQRQQWLPGIASGETILTTAWLEPRGGFDPAGVRLAATPSGDGFLLAGEKSHVPFAKAADRILVLARTGPEEDAIDLFLLDPTAAGVSWAQERTMASDTQYRVRLDGVRVEAGDRVGEAGRGWWVWMDALHDGAILLAAQAMGGAARALEMTVTYAKEREQFGKPLGAFQSLAHYMADASTTIAGGQTLVYEAAWARDRGRSIRRLAPMAKSFACGTFHDVTRVAQQIHGGMGFSVEYDIQLYFRRAKQLELSWWDTPFLEELVAADALDS